jgi:hypothetical protein
VKGCLPHPRVLIQREKQSANFTLFRLAEAELIKVIVEGDTSRSFGKQLIYFREGKGELVGSSFVSEVDVTRHVPREGIFTDFSKVRPNSSHPIPWRK